MSVAITHDREYQVASLRGAGDRVVCRNARSFSIWRIVPSPLFYFLGWSATVCVEIRCPKPLTLIARSRSAGN